METGGASPAAVKKTRSSQFELLRILAMLIIVMHHYAVHGGFAFIGVTGNRFFVDMFGMGGHLGDNLFMLISAWFLCRETRFRMKGAVLLFLQVTFFSVLLYGVAVIVGPTEFSLSSFMAYALPFIYYENANWFAVAYFMLLLFAPFLARASEALGRRSHGILLLVCFVCFYCIPTFFDRFPYGNELILFVFLFFVASYIKKYPTAFTENRRFNGIATLIFGAFFLLSVPIALLLGLRFPGLIEHATGFRYMQKIPCLLFSVSLFCFMKNRKPFVSRAVNRLAGCMFTVYLIHDHKLIRPLLWQSLFRCPSYQDSPFLFLHAMIAVLSVFLACTLLGLLYGNTVDRLFRFLYARLSAPVSGFFGRLGRGLYRCKERAAAWIEKRFRD